MHHDWIIAQACFIVTPKTYKKLMKEYKKFSESWLSDIYEVVELSINVNESICVVL